MAKSKGKVQIGVMMTDKEFQEYHDNIRKENLLKDMFAAANQPFSVKNVSKKKETKKEESKNKDGSIKTYSPVTLTNSDAPKIGDDEWEEILSKASTFSSPSPIDQITRNVMGEFSLEDIGIKDEESTFQTMFKTEQAMLAELLKDVTKHAKAAGTKLDDMTKKSAGYGGVSKTYADLVSATNALNSTRLSIVKEMAGLKKTIADLEMKKMKESGDTAVTSNDDVANSFYEQIVHNRKQFVEDSMNSYYGDRNQQNKAPVQLQNNHNDNQSYLGNTENIEDMQYEDQSPRKSRSITSSLYYEDDNDDYVSNNADPYGYIRNEKNGIKICVERYPDGRVNFVAVDENGDGVDDYELPGDDLLMDLEIRPMSQWAVDGVGRRYRIIDVDADGVDISDILDEDE